MEAICILNHPKYAAMSIEEHQAALTEEQWTILMAWMATKIGNREVRYFEIYFADVDLQLQKEKFETCKFEQNLLEEDPIKAMLGLPCVLEVSQNVHFAY
jgi:hypothetical protein